MNSNLPEGIRHALEVCRLVRLSHRTRISAIKEVARSRRIDHQTVLSACTRSIGINTTKLDEFLLVKNSDKFCQHLVQRFPLYQKDIEPFFRQLEGDDSESNDDPTRIVRTLFPDEKKDLLRLLLLHEVRKQLILWSDRDDIPENLKHEMIEIKKRIDKT